jgi:hypothetical protein
MPRADSLVRFRTRHSRDSRFSGTGFCVCLHALSSFQRTDISKRPWRFAHTGVWLRRSFRRRRRFARPRSGELTEITIAICCCQPFFRSLSKYLGAALLGTALTANFRASGNAVGPKLAVFPGTGKVRCLVFSKLSAALQRVSRAECSESMAYKNWAVNPHAQFFLTAYTIFTTWFCLLPFLSTSTRPPMANSIEILACTSAIRRLLR